MTEPTRRKRRGCCLGCTIALLVAMVLPILVWLIATAVTGARVRAELDRLRKAGEPVDLADLGGKLAPHVPPGVDNAAPLYQEAFDIWRDAAGMYSETIYSPAKWTAEDRQAARTFVQTNQQYFRLLDQASRIRECEFSVQWDDPTNALFPYFTKLREAARGLSLKAEVEAADGKLENAVATCATSLRLVKHTETTPNLFGPLTAVAIQGVGLKELSRVLSTGTPSAATCRRLFTEFDDPDRNQYWVRAAQGERLTGLSTYQGIEEGRLPADVLNMDGSHEDTWRFTLLSTLGRPWWNQDKLRYLQHMGQMVEGFRHPWPQPKSLRLGLVWQFGSTSYAPSALLLPELTPALWSRDKAAAELGAARIALAAKAYHGEHDRYPASLAELASAGWQLPLDPFTGKAFLYRREGPGFAVWSTGPDLKDNNATEIDYQKFKTDQPGYDFVFRCAR